MITARDLDIQLKHRTGPVDLLKNASLHCGANSFTVISGQSGSGKSTLLNVLAGLIKPTAGSVHLLGQDLANQSERQLTRLRRSEISLIFQAYNLLPGLNALENVAYGLPLRNGKETARAALARMGLAHRVDQRPNWMSGGEQQRVAVARALARSPRILLADEPTAALDPDNTEIILAALRDLARIDGAAVLMVSHDPAIAARADQHLVVRDGALHHA